jgi:hypothetical protein
MNSLNDFKSSKVFGVDDCKKKTQKMDLNCHSVREVFENKWPTTEARILVHIQQSNSGPCVHPNTRQQDHQ